MKPSKRQMAEGILFTDEYRLKMAHLCDRLGLHEKQAQFNHFFRYYPDYNDHQAGFFINEGLEWLLDWMQAAHFRRKDIEYLRSQTGKYIFVKVFLAWLQQHGMFKGITMRATPEGRVEHPNVPITVVQRPLVIAQILEIPLLNYLNYPIHIATNATHVRQVGRGQPLLGFSLRRAPERGANAGIQAAFNGGTDFTSNVDISQVLGYLPKGSHAHSMVKVFMALGEDELSPIQAYADVSPDDYLLLVDTINILESGISNAIMVFETLRRKGHKPAGIRLASDDLAYLTFRAAKMLNEAGFGDAPIILSNQLDAMTNWQILTPIEKDALRYGLDADQVISCLQNGVGTRLITSGGNAALAGVYKLEAKRDKGDWIPAVKVSNSPARIPNPGHKRTGRMYNQRSKATADLLKLDDEKPLEIQQIVLHHPTENTTYRTLRREKVSQAKTLLVGVLPEGGLVTDPPIAEIRKRRHADIERLDSGVNRLMNPHIYDVSLKMRLWHFKQKLIGSALAGQAGLIKYRTTGRYSRRPRALNGLAVG